MSEKMDQDEEMKIEDELRIELVKLKEQLQKKEAEAQENLVNAWLEDRFDGSNNCYEFTLHDALAVACFKNDVGRLKILLERAKQSDIYRFNYDMRCLSKFHLCNCNLLITSVRGNSYEVFCHLLTLDAIPLDHNDCRGQPLIIAIYKTDVHSPFRYILPIVESGRVNVNVQNSHGETALYYSVKYCDFESAELLLHYGADMMIEKTNRESSFEKALYMGDHDIQELFYNYLFTSDELKIPLRLSVLTSAMESYSLFFPDLINRASSIVYDEYDINKIDINDWIQLVEIDYLDMFLVKLKNVARAVFVVKLPEVFHPTFEYIEFGEKFFNFLCSVLYSDLAADSVTCVGRTRICSQIYYIFTNLSIHNEIISQMILHLMSHGALLTCRLMNKIYNDMGYCKLFKTALHTPIIDRNPMRHDFSFFPDVIYNVHLKLDNLLDNLYISRTCLANCGKLWDFFVCPKLRSMNLPCSSEVRKKIAKAPKVPKLIELARNASRCYIVEAFDVKTCAQFYSILNKINLPLVCKQIISFERKIYEYE